MAKLYKKLFIVLFSFLICSGLYSQSKKNFDLEDIFYKKTFAAKSVKGYESLNDGNYYTSLDYNEAKEVSIVKYKFETGEKVETIVRENDLVVDGTDEKIEIESYDFNSDETKIIFPVTRERIYRYSALNDYYVYDLKTQKLKKITDKPALYAGFSPDGNKISYVRDNNLYYYDLNSEKEIQITFDGKRNYIINGASDWVYEEEFGLKDSYLWSPNSTQIAFYKFDESRVKEYTYISYEDSLYPRTYSYKYPKAGEDNSIVDIYVFDLNSGTSVKINLGEDKNYYIPCIKWTNDKDVFCITKLNRLQNSLELILVNYTNYETKTIFKEENKYYLNITGHLTFINGNKNFIWTSEMSGYNQIYLFDINGKPVNQITTGNYEVMDYYGYDEKKGVVYYSLADESPAKRNLYSIKLDGSGKTKLSEQSGFNIPKFNKDYTFYLNYYYTINTPVVCSIYNSEGKLVRIIEDNPALRKKISEYNTGKFEFFKFKTSENIELNGWMLKPVDFDPGKKYPVMIYVYGGPGAQTVVDIWNGTLGLWYQYLAHQGFIIVSVDGRGTSGRGEEFKKVTYLQLGKYETDDMIETAKYLSSLGYVNQNKIGIFGWSYGGYMAAMCITKGADYFNTAVAVAPVTNWRYYDNIYMERYMRTPQENPQGYDDNSPIKYVDNLKGNFLIIQGMADDNVHFQNSVEMVNAMINANKKFDAEYYPDKNHSIYGGKTRLHLFTRITDYLISHLK